MSEGVAYIAVVKKILKELSLSEVHQVLDFTRYLDDSSSAQKQSEHNREYFYEIPHR